MLCDHAFRQARLTSSQTRATGLDKRVSLMSDELRAAAQRDALQTSKLEEMEMEIAALRSHEEDLQAEIERYLVFPECACSVGSILMPFSPIYSSCAYFFSIYTLFDSTLY